jgi:hypothetical protein
VNFIQKNPTDSRHEEYHDGEYEYWPQDGALKSKSISIPAALVSGLELLAAAAATGLLVIVLAVLYVLSSPQVIRENSAVINANVFNSRDGQRIVYTLATASNPEIILQDGTLRKDEDTLFLENLTAETAYLLRYYDEQQNEVGSFRFTTPGSSAPVQPSEPPGVPTVPPESTQIPSEAETTAPAATEATEVTEAPTEETVPETTEAATEPNNPGYQPPAPGTKPTDPTTEPTDPTTEPAEPEIIVMEADMGEVVYIPPEFSGDEIDAYFQFEEYHTFRNVPADGYTIRIIQGETEITEYTSEWSEDGTLFISFTGNPIPVGMETTTTVMLTVGSNTYISTNTVFPPSLESVDVTVTKNEDGTHTFTVVANVVSDGIEQMVCEVILYTVLDDYEGVSLLLTAESGSRYTASYTTRIESENDSEQADILVTAYWARLAPESYYQSAINHCIYTP